MDFSTLIPWICTSLNAPSVAELGEWSEAELYAYAEEALQNLAGRVLLLAAYDDSTAIVANQPLYELAAAHIATVFAAVDGVALKPATVAEVEALDDNWEEAASAAPTRWVGNALGQKFIRLYPPPASGTALQLIFQQQPPAVTAASPVVLMPAPLGDYMAHKALKHARARQGDGQMTDAAAAFDGLAAAYEAAARGLWCNA